MIPYLGFLVLLVLLAAYHDDERISLGLPIHHLSGNLVRMALAAIMLFACWRMLDLRPLVVVLLAMFSFPAFSLLFRLRLNALRGHPWWYVSPTSDYDHVWLSLSDVTGFFKWGARKVNRRNHHRLIRPLLDGELDWYALIIWRTGRRASWTEGILSVVLLASCILLAIFGPAH